MGKKRDDDETTVQKLAKDLGTNEATIRELGGIPKDRNTVTRGEYDTIQAEVPR